MPSNSSSIITQSFGSTLLQTSNGVPTDVVSAGSRYVDKNTGILYIYDSDDGWVKCNTTTYGNVYIDGNTTQTTINAATTWFPLTGLTWTAGSFNGVTNSANGTMTIKTNRNGRYFYNFTVTLQFVATTTFYEAGLSVNGASPASGAFVSAIPATGVPSSVGCSGYLDLVAGNTVQLFVRVRTGFGAGNIIIRNASLNLLKVQS